mmetsp:Transcript_115526/g.172617  ORF Transcript_115526/g.172617 Transcript_115526/m.172617 type:complete len:276 (-) Transcript_115526:116-943(-)
MTTYVRENHILGEGTYATVYKGHIKHDKSPCAIKVVNYAKFTNTEMRQLEKEVQTLAKLSAKFPDPTKNPFIHIYSASVTSINELSIITELATGEELDILTSRFVSGIPERITKFIFSKILNAVKILHEENMCHLDLKLENIMFDRRSRSKIKILDFGFARNTRTLDGDIQYHNMFCGSVHYVAPEIVNHVPYDGCKADVWALGVTLFALLTGSFPFDSINDDHHSIFSKIRENKVRFPAFLSTTAVNLLKSMLRSNALQRPSISEIMTHQWFER